MAPQLRKKFSNNAVNNGYPCGKELEYIHLVPAQFGVSTSIPADTVQGRL